MIEVPALVKEALREGAHLKEYRFTFPDVHVGETWTEVLDYVETELAPGVVKRVYTLSINETYKAITTYTGSDPGYDYVHILILYIDEYGNTVRHEENVHDGTPYEFTPSSYFVSASLELVFDSDFSFEVDVRGDAPLVIDNNRLVSESVKFDERMCSDKNLKFGLCEGTNLEFQAFDIPNLTGQSLYAAIRIQYKTEDNTLDWYTIPLGWFTVDETSRQATTGIRKVSCYNKLLSDYLDAKANGLIEEVVDEGETGKPEHTVSLRTMLDRLLENYYIEVEPDIKLDLHPVTNNSSYNADCFTRLNSSFRNSGYYLRTLMLNRYITIDGGYKGDSYYRVVMNPKAIDAYFEQRRRNRIRDNGGNLYEYYPGYLEPDSMAGTHGTYYDLSATQSHERLRVAGRLTYNILDNRNTEVYDTGWMTGLDGVYIISVSVPIIYQTKTQYNDQISDEDADEMDEEFSTFESYLMEHLTIMERNLTEIEKKAFSLTDVEEWPDVSLRDLQSATFEMACQYGRLDRQTDLFSGVELNNSRLLPADTLYPDNSLYPDSVAERSNPAMYSKLWADEGNVRSFRYLIITYKGTEVVEGQTQEVEKTLQRTVNADGTDDYNMSDNWLFKNLVWSDSNVADYAAAMVAKMRNMTWFPFEMWCAGLPYIETGDEVEINMADGAYTSYVLRRNLNGIQNLQDEMINGTLDIF